MPDLLIVCPESDAIAKLTEIGERKGFRVKSSVDYQSAKGWLDIRKFEVAFVYSSIPIDQQQLIADSLWRSKPSATYVVFDLKQDLKSKRHELKLFGAELAFGKGAVAQLEKILEAALGDKIIDRAEFPILVVEDLDSPRDIICFFIESMGFKVVKGKRSGREAIEELESGQQKYSCIITDIRMPDVNGQELISYIRAHPRWQHLPVIVLTAYGSVDCLIDCLKAGASGFLVKPPKKQDLNRELGRAFRIANGETSPRLATHDEADAIRELLIDKGFS